MCTSDGREREKRKERRRERERERVRKELGSLIVKEGERKVLTM